MPSKSQTTNSPAKAVPLYEELSFNELLLRLQDPNLDLKTWVHYIHHLYPEKMQSRYSFYAKEINSFRNYKFVSENTAKIANLAMIALAISIAALNIPAASIVGGAAVTLTTLRVVFSLPKLNFMPKVRIKKDISELDEQNTAAWQSYREQWDLNTNKHELSIQNEETKVLVFRVCLAVTLGFAAYIALASQAATVGLVLASMAYGVSLMLSSKQAPEIENANLFPDETPNVRAIAN